MDDKKECRAQALQVAAQDGKIILVDDDVLDNLTVEYKRPSTDDDLVDLGYLK